MNGLKIESVQAEPKYGTDDGAAGFVEVRVQSSGELIFLHFDGSLYQPVLRGNVIALWKLAGATHEEAIAAADKAESMAERCLAANRRAR